MPPASTDRDPIIALVLNLLLAGAGGYVYLGQRGKAAISLVLWVFALVKTCGAASGIVALIAAIDGYLQGQQLQQGHPIGEWTFFNDHR